MAQVLLVVLLLLQVQEPSATTVLEKMIAGRRAYTTADIGWVHSNKNIGDQNYRSRFDGRNWTTEQLGNDDGVVILSQLGKPGSCSPVRHLVADGLHWETYDSGPDAIVSGPFGIESREPLNIIDARTLGLMPENTTQDLDRLLLSLMRKADDFSVKDSKGDICVVVMKEGDYRVTWWIDTKRNYNPIRVERTNIRGEVLAQSTTELALYDEHVWFPKLVRIREERDGGRTATMTVKSAEFDRPRHPVRLGPADIGIVELNTVHVTIAGKRSPLSLWHDGHFVPLTEIRQQQKDGTLPDSAWLAWEDRVERCVVMQGGKWPSWMNDRNYGIGKPSDIDAWDAYVRRFCIVRKLDGRQKASAHSILDDCRKTAVPMVSRIKADQAKEKDAARREAMLAPVAAIFTNSLVPRLESLLTTPQSQPAKREPVTSRPG